MSDCKHGMERDWCSLCKAPPTRPRPTREPGAPTTAARFSGGRCPAGDDTIYEGEDITLTDDGWAHTACLQ